jgi:hypothetical protein
MGEWSAARFAAVLDQDEAEVIGAVGCGTVSVPGRVLIGVRETGLSHGSARLRTIASWRRGDGEVFCLNRR